MARPALLFRCSGIGNAGPSPCWETQHASHGARAFLRAEWGGRCLGGLTAASRARADRFRKNTSVKGQCVFLVLSEGNWDLVDFFQIECDPGF
jgi:hypothetical protein